MLSLTVRALLLFLKDKTTVFLSFLAEFIIVGLYLLFIKDNLLRGFQDVVNVELLLDVWMLAGILGVASFTTTMSAYGIMIEDRVKRIEKDFEIAPISAVSVLLGYLVSAVVIGYIVSVLLFLLARVYLLHWHHIKLGGELVLRVYGVLFVITVANAALVLLLVSFLKTSNALSSCCTILGALVGFLTGIYLPMGNLPSGVQLLVQHFPVSHGVVLLRQSIMEPFLIESFTGKTENQSYFMKYMGIQFWMEESMVTQQASIWILIITGIVSLLVAIIKYMRSGK